MFVILELCKLLVVIRMLTDASLLLCKWVAADYCYFAVKQVASADGKMVIIPSKQV